MTTVRLLGAITSNMKYKNILGPQMYRFYSTSNRETFKAEAPIGVYQNGRTAFQLDLLGVRLGESYNRLSRHVNLYFRQKQVSVMDYEQDKALTQPPRRVQRDRRSGETIEQVQEAYPGLQLFHISSLANRFGESYSYVANHINTVFSPKQIHVNVSPDEGFRKSRIRMQRVTSSKSVIHEETTQRLMPEIDDNICSSWEEGYLHFARHINRYFGAKVADKGHQIRITQKTSDSKTKDHTSLLHPKSPGLFHMSSLTTRFGENYTHMAKHINQYFKGSTASENDQLDGELEHYRHSPELIQNKSVSFFDCLLNPSTIPGFVGSYLGMSSGRQIDQTKTMTRTAEEMLDTTVSHL